MIVRFSLRAATDLEDIIDYLMSRSPDGARSVAASLNEAIRLIGDHPDTGQRTQKAHVLVKVVARYPYKVFYRRRREVIEILHIRHASRRPWLP